MPVRTGLLFRQVYPKQNGRQLGISERLPLEAELRASQDRFCLVDILPAPLPRN
jgi:hypothetical protein